MEDEPDCLRARAVRLYAMALHICHTEPEYADKLVAQAIELQDQAA